MSRFSLGVFLNALTNLFSFGALMVAYHQKVFSCGHVAWDGCKRGGVFDLYAGVVEFIGEMLGIHVNIKRPEFTISLPC